MYLSGISDEAGAAIETQIKAHKELGWEHMELRAVQPEGEERLCIHDISDAGFDQVEKAIKDAGMKVSCFGATIANWAKSIHDPFEETLAEVERCIPRMKRLDCQYVRIMSYAVLKEEGKETVLPDQLKDERFKRVAEINKRFADEGLVAVHENCMNYGGMGHTYTQELIENVPGLRLVFDTGNPVFAADIAKGEPYPRQSAWEFWSNVKDHVDYIHIKDGVWNAENGKADFCLVGEGEGDVKKILKDAFASGYDSGISIEPHVALVFHEDGGDEAKKAAAYESYIKYGTRMAEIVDELK